MRMLNYGGTPVIPVDPPTFLQDSWELICKDALLKKMKLGFVKMVRLALFLQFMS
jgi:hypothetical protein